MESINDRKLISYFSFEDFWDAVIQEKDFHSLDDAPYVLTKELALVIWKHAIASKENTMYTGIPG
jgi:hypothetical protein